MKKLVLVLAVAFSASLFSCSGKADKAAVTATDSAAVVTEEVEVAVVNDTVAPDSVVTDTVVAAAAEVAQQ